MGIPLLTGSLDFDAFASFSGSIISIFQNSAFSLSLKFFSLEKHVRATFVWANEEGARSRAGRRNRVDKSPKSGKCFL